MLAQEACRQTPVTLRFPNICLGVSIRKLKKSLASVFLRKVNREREQAFEASMKLYRDASPEDVGVTSKLFPQEPCLQGSYPYESAVQELKLILKDCCPQRKLECIGESDWVFKMFFIFFSGVSLKALNLVSLNFFSLPLLCCS